MAPPVYNKAKYLNTGNAFQIEPHIYLNYNNLAGNNTANNLFLSFIQESDPQKLEQAEKAIAGVRKTMGYHAGRGAEGAMFITFVLGQRDSKGKPLFTYDDIVDPTVRPEEKKALFRRFTSVLSDPKMMSQIDEACVRGTLMIRETIIKEMKGTLNKPETAMQMMQSNSFNVLLAVSMAINETWTLDDAKPVRDRIQSLTSKSDDLKKDYNNVLNHIQKGLGTPEDPSMVSAVSYPESQTAAITSLQNSFKNFYRTDGFTPVSQEIRSAIMISNLKHVHEETELQNGWLDYNESFDDNMPADFLGLLDETSANKLNKNTRCEWEDDKAAMENVFARMDPSPTKKTKAGWKSVVKKNVEPLLRLCNDATSDPLLRAGIFCMIGNSTFLTNFNIPTQFDPQIGRRVVSDYDKLNLKIPSKSEIFRSLIQNDFELPEMNTIALSGRIETVVDKEGNKNITLGPIDQCIEKLEILFPDKTDSMFTPITSLLKNMKEAVNLPPDGLTDLTKLRHMQDVFNRTIPSLFEYLDKRQKDINNLPDGQEKTKLQDAAVYIGNTLNKDIIGSLNQLLPVVEAGLVKLPEHTQAYDSNEIIEERAALLKSLSEDFEKNKTDYPSVEWQLMEKGLARAKAAHAVFEKSIDHPESRPTTADTIELSYAMEELQHAAEKYLEYKAKQSKSDFSKSYARVFLANRVKRTARREAAQLAPVVKEKRQEIAGNFSSRAAIDMQEKVINALILEFESKGIKGSSTPAYEKMFSNLQNLQQRLKTLASGSEDPSNQQQEELSSFVTVVRQSVNDYLKHKELSNNHSVRSERRITIANEAKAFLDSALSTITYRTVYGSLNDRIFPEALADSIEPKELHDSMLQSYPNLLDVATQPPCTTRNELNNRLEIYRDAMMPLLTIACLKGRNLEMTALRQEVLDILNDDGEMKDKFDKIAALEVNNGDKTYAPFANVIAYAASNPNFLVENFALEYDSLMGNLSSTFAPAWQNGKIQSLTEKFGPIKQPNVAEKVVQPNPKEDRDASHKEENKNENVSNAEVSNIEAPNVDVSNIDVPVDVPVEVPVEVPVDVPVEVPVEVPNVETKANQPEQPRAETSGIEVPDEYKLLLKEIEADCLKEKFPEALFPNVQKSFADLSKIHFEQAPKTPEEVKQRQEQYKNAMMPLLTYALFKTYPDSGFGEMIKNRLDNTNKAFDEKLAKGSFGIVYLASGSSRARNLFDEQIYRAANNPHYVDTLLKGNLEKLTFSVKPKLSEGLKELLYYSGFRNILSEELTNAQIQLENLPPVSDEQERNKIVRESIAPFICAAIMYDDFIKINEYNGSAQTIYSSGGSKELINLIAESNYAKDISKSILDGKQTIKSFLEQKPEDFVKDIHDIKPTFKGELDKLLNELSHKDHSLDKANPKELASKKKPEHSTLVSGMIEQMNKYGCSDAIKQAFNKAANVLEGPQKNVKISQRQHALGMVMCIGVLLGARNNNTTLPIEGNCAENVSPLSNIVSNLAKGNAAQKIADNKVELESFLKQKPDDFLSNMYGLYTQRKKVRDEAKEKERLKSQEKEVNEKTNTVEQQTDAKPLEISPKVKLQMEEHSKALYEKVANESRFNELKEATKVGIEQLNEIVNGAKPSSKKQAFTMVKNVSRMLAAVAINDIFVPNNTKADNSQDLIDAKYKYIFSKERRENVLNRISNDNNLIEFATNLVKDPEKALDFLSMKPTDVSKAIREMIPNVEIVKQQKGVQLKELGKTMKTAIADYEKDAMGDGRAKKLFDHVAGAITYLEDSLSMNVKPTEDRWAKDGSQVLAGLAVLKALQSDKAANRDEFTKAFEKDPESLLQAAMEDKKLQEFAKTMFAPDKLSETLNMDSKTLTDKLLDGMDKPLTEVFGVDVPSEVKNVEEKQKEKGNDVEEELDIGG